MRHHLAFLIILSAAFSTAACKTTFRDDDGTIHDSNYNARQAKVMVDNAPLLIPFVPVGIAGNAIKASLENGQFQLAGTVTDENGSPLTAVSLKIVKSQLVNFDLSNDAPIFAEQAELHQVGPHFHIALVNQHTVSLHFTKDGYAPADYHFEILGPGQEYPTDKTPKNAKANYHLSPLIEPELKVILHPLANHASRG